MKRSSSTSSMLIWSLLVSLCALFISCGSSVDAAAVLNKRQNPNIPNNVPVQLNTVSYDALSSTLSGQIWIQNLAFAKVVELFYSLDNTDNTWDTQNQIAASYLRSVQNNYEIWKFEGKTRVPLKSGAKFYLKYQVNGRTFYDNNNQRNYVVDFTTPTQPPQPTINPTDQPPLPTAPPTNTNPPPPPPTATACPEGGIQRRLYTVANSARYLVVEVLSDTIVNFEVSEQRKPPKDNVIHKTLMVDTEHFASRFCGASSLAVSGAGDTTLETPKLRITVDTASLSVTVFDKVKQRALTTFSYASLNVGALNSIPNPYTPQLRWTREATQGIFGLAQSPGYDNPRREGTEGNWLGTRMAPPSEFGNLMVGQDRGAMSFTQLPIAYHVGPQGYNYAIFMNDQHAITWDFTTSTHSATSRGGRALRWFVVGGESLVDLRRQYMAIVGRTLVPSKAYLGHHQCKFGYVNWADAMNDLTSINRAGIPIDNLVFDLFWFGDSLGRGVNSKFGTLAWDTTNFPDPVTNVQKIRALGPGITVIEEPYIAQNGPTFNFLNASNALATRSDRRGPVILNSNPWWGIGGYIDHSGVGGKLWATCKRCPLITGCVVPDVCKNQGLEATAAVDEMIGHWQDLGEPEQFDPNAQYAGFTEDDNVQLTSHRTIHNVYQFLITKETHTLYVEQKLKRRPMSLVRTGAPGIQRYGGALWSGDISANLNSMALHIGSKKHLIMAGIDIHSSDIGGFRREGCQAPQCNINNLYTIWMANSAWFDLPIRPHLDASRDRSLTANAAVMGDLESNRFNIRMRYTLIPLYYSLSYEAYLNGDPIITPLFMKYQDIPALYNFGNQYQIGPIMAAYTSDDIYNGPQGRGVWLPANSAWFHFHTHEVYRGTGNYSRDISYRPFRASPNLVTMPALVQSGSVIPLAQVDNQTKNVRCGDRWDGSSVCLSYWRVYPGPAGKFTLYEDDGETQAYLNGAYTTTETSQVTEGNKVTVTVGETKGTPYAGYVERKLLVVEVVIPPNYVTVESVTVDGVAVTAAPAGTTPATSADVKGFIVGGFNNRLVSVYGGIGAVNVARTVVVNFK
ncbi:hypothetical protein HDV05_002941 [Chytridiales sp. JEL 0842]|nr:hypothetical protein HDV05_002941 [Chytridiales sp. JEL 0842]